MFLSDKEVKKECELWNLEFLYRFNISNNNKSYEMVFVKDNKAKNFETFMICLAVKGLPIASYKYKNLTKEEAIENIIQYKDEIESKGGNFFEVLETTISKIKSENIPMMTITTFVNKKGNQVASIYAGIKNGKLILKYDYTKGYNLKGVGNYAWGFGLPYEKAMANFEKLPSKLIFEDGLNMKMYENENNIKAFLRLLENEMR